MQPENNGLRPLQITEEDLASAAPSVRALLIARLEQLWAPVAMHLEREQEGLPIDPRMLEFGLRVCKEEAGLYRLARPPVTGAEDDLDDPGAGVDRRALVEVRLAELEQKQRANEQAKEQAA